MNPLYTAIVCLSLLFCVSNTFAQPKQWAPVGATWHYTSYDTTGEWSVPRKIQVTGDTVILGKPCRKIEGLAPFLPNSTGIFQQLTYTYDSSRVIYLYDFNTNEFTQLFNQNLVKGDTFFYKWNAIVDTLVIVNKFTIPTYRADTFIVDSLIYFHFDTLKYKDQFFIQNIGFYNSFILYDRAFDFRNTIIDTNLNKVRCYQDTSIFFKIHDFNWDCEYKNLWRTSIDERKNEPTVGVYPNPSSGTFEITKDIEVIGITDITGRPIPFEQHNNSIILTQSYKGLAILQIQNHHKKVFTTIKIIIL